MATALVLYVLIMNDVIYRLDRNRWYDFFESFVVVQQETLYALLEIEGVKIVEGHKVTVASEDEHFVVEDVDWLAVSCAGFLSDDEAMGIVVDDLLVHFVFVLLLDSYINGWITYRF